MTKTAEAKKEVVAVFQAPRLPWHDAISERYGDTGVNKGNWRALIDACYPAAQTVDAVLLVLQYCQRMEIDPFQRPVHIVPMWSSAKRAMVETVWPGIALLRTIAWRTKLCAGIDAAIFGPDKTREFSGEVGKETKTVKKISLTFPEWAQVVVYRLVEGQRVAIAGPRVYWEETYAPASRFSELPNEMWERRKRGQLEKCAEAAALRRAFPESIGNEYAAEEMTGKEIMHELPIAPAPAPERTPSPPQASAAVLDALVEAEAAQGFDPETGEIREEGPARNDP